MKNKLPPKFLERIRTQLADEYDDFLKSYENRSERGLRINTLKINKEVFEKQAPWEMEPVPWIEGGYFCDRDADLSGHPYYRAGLFYIQEPSAMTPADRLDVIPGHKVLDLCAAPGGKSTRLAAKLDGKGILVSNDISASRCRALVQNLELTGAANIIVTNEIPARLEAKFPEYFDRIMVDAPCSGEGMFRKEEAVIDTWSPERAQYFANIQRSILKSAMNMLVPGGYLMYSTCTFSPDENEGSISALLEEYPGTEICDIAFYEGFSSGVPQWGNDDERLKKSVRIWPHKMRGEGHFMALLKKAGSTPEITAEKRRKKREKGTRNTFNGSFSKEEKLVMRAFLDSMKSEFAEDFFENRGGKVFYMPFDKELAAGLKFMRCGLFMGELKKNRFEPSQALALFIGREGFKNTISFDCSDERIAAYLKGEDIKLKSSETAENGWILVASDGFPLGFGKKNSDGIKNKYLWLR